MAIKLCRADEISDDDSRGFDLPQCRLFAVKKRGTIYLYLNRCPHLGIALDWLPHKFLDSEALYIRCANHGAFFLPETGECIQGPCIGDALWAIDYSLEDGWVMIDEAELPAAPAPA